MNGRTIDTLDDISDGLAALVKLDSRLVRVVECAGAVPLRRQPPGYEGLANIIVSQMVSKASARAIWMRLLDVASGCNERQILDLTDAQCRRIGLSRSKEQTLKAAAQAVMDGVINPEALCLIPAKTSMATMTAIKGIGPWTAEVYLLFCAGHCDIFPAGDVALQAAVGHALGMKQRPSQKAVGEIATIWQPWRGVAARLFWAYYATEMQRGDVVPTADS